VTLSSSNQKRLIWTPVDADGWADGWFGVPYPASKPGKEVKPYRVKASEF